MKPTPSAVPAVDLEVHTQGKGEKDNKENEQYLTFILKRKTLCQFIEKHSKVGI